MAEEVAVEEQVETEEIVEIDENTPLENLSDAEMQDAISQATIQDTEKEEVSKEPEKQDETQGKEEEDTNKEDIKEESEPVTLESLQKDLADLNEKHAAQVKRNDDQNNFIMRQTNELGDLRKQTKQPELNKEELVEKFLEDPQGTVNEILNSRDQEENTILAENREIEFKNKETIHKIIPEFDSLKDDMIKTFAADTGEDEALIRQSFEQNLYKDPSFVINLARRVKTERENTTLKEQVKQMNEKISNVSDKIENAAKKGLNSIASLSEGGDGGSELDVSDLTDIQIANLSEKDLKAHTDKLLRSANT